MAIIVDFILKRNAAAILKNVMQHLLKLYNPKCYLTCQVRNIHRTPRTQPLKTGVDSVVNLNLWKALQSTYLFTLLYLLESLNWDMGRETET